MTLVFGGIVRIVLRLTRVRGAAACRLLVTLCFFHPLMRWALERLTEERGHLCDLDVTRVIAGERSIGKG